MREEREHGGIGGLSDEIVQKMFEEGTSRVARKVLSSLLLETSVPDIPMADVVDALHEAEHLTSEEKAEVARVVYGYLKGLKKKAPKRT